jgi:hypothetical protein
MIYCATTSPEEQGQATMDWDLWNHEPK